MKIIHLIYDHPRNPWVGGGGAVRVYELSKRLALKGHHITVVSGRYPGAKDYTEGNLEYKFVGSDAGYLLSTFSYAFRAAGFIRRFSSGFDILVEDFAPWNPIFSRFLTDRPAVLHVNHREGWNMFKRFSIFAFPFFLVEKFYPSLFKHVTALSEDTKRKIGVSEAVVLPPGINAVHQSGQLEGGHILYMGRLHMKNKGLDTLLSSMKGVDSELLLVGRGPDEQRLKNMASGVSRSKIKFSGFVSETQKAEILESSLFMVLPSRFEGWGIVVLESAAFGKPVIVSDIPELAYAVEGGFGLSFKTGDASDLTEKINLILKDKDLRIKLGARAVEYARNFTWDGIADKCERCYAEALKSGIRVL
ncbi:MAG: glycosyltransferase family 1 protein [Nitrospirae bacterium]|nr:MAG: glycosyltransferase family 1 protein [Nitrospirota bacterium]